MCEESSWKSEFEHFNVEFNRLKRGLRMGELSDLAREGLARRFTRSVSFACKTLNDRLIWEGLGQAECSRHAVSVASQAGIIDDSQNWIDMLDQRDLVTNTLDAQIHRQTEIDIRSKYENTLQTFRDQFARDAEQPAF